MTQDILRSLARAKATFQAHTLETILTEGKPMTHEHTANEEARHGNREALEQVTRERDRLREALEEVKDVLSLIERPAQPDPKWHHEVKALGQRIGFGALMSTAEAGWRELLEAEGFGGGEYVSGPCRVTVNSALETARAALEDDQ